MEPHPALPATAQQEGPGPDRGLADPTAGVITCYDGFAAPKSDCPDLPFYGLLKKSGHLFDPITGRPVNPATGFAVPKRAKNG